MLPVEELGMGTPVVLIHAGIADRTMWRQLLGPLARAGFRAIALDLPGFGDAAVPPGPQAPWEDVLATMRGLDVGSAHLVGNSFGAAVALRIAVVAPSAVLSLMLVSPPPLDDAEPSPALAAAWEAEEAALERGDREAAVSAVLDAWLAPSAPTELRQQVATMQRRAFDQQRSVPDVTQAPDPLERDPTAVPRVEVPVLALAGDADMPDFKRGAEEIATAVRNGRSSVLAGAGHLAPLEAPEAFWAALCAHLTGQ